MGDWIIVGIFASVGAATWLSIVMGLHGARNRILGDFAARRKGTVVVPAGLLSGEPVVAFAHGAYPVRYFDGHRRPGHREAVTEVRLAVRAVNPLGFTFEIYPETILDKVAKLFWLQDVQVIDPPFDDAFILRTNSEPALKRLLTTRCRLLILQLHGLCNEPDTYLKLDRDHLTIIKGCRLADERTMTQFYELCEGIFDCVLAFLGAPGVVAPETEIRFIDADEGPRLLPAPAPVCQLCGEHVTGAGVACTRCGTVHHRDCWDYNGECTTYACGCRRCVPHP